MRELTFVVALSDAEARRQVAKRLRDRLTLLGQRHVAVVTPPEGGIAMFQLVQEELGDWWAEHVITEASETFLCLDHEPGLRDWTASVASMNILVRVVGHDDAGDYDGQAVVRSLIAEDLIQFTDMVMALAPSLDPDDEAIGAFAGVRVAASVAWGGAPEVALHDAEKEPIADSPAEGADPLDNLPMPTWRTVEDAEEVEPDDGTSADASQEVEASCLVDDDEMRWEAPTPEVTAIDPGISAAVELLDSEPHVDVDEDIEDVDDLEVEDEAQGVEEYEVGDEAEAQEDAPVPPEAHAPEVPPREAGGPISSSAPIAPPENASSKAFFDQYAESGDGVEAPIDQEAGAASTQGAPATEAQPLLSSGVASTPHPFVLFAAEVNSRSAVAPAPSPRPAPAPTSARQVPTAYTGPASLPSPIAQVWGDDDTSVEEQPIPAAPATSLPVPEAGMVAPSVVGPGPSVLPDDEPAAHPFSVFGDETSDWDLPSSADLAVPLASHELEPFSVPAPLASFEVEDRRGPHTKPQRIPAGDPAGRSVRGIFDRLKPTSGGGTVASVRERLFASHRTSSPRVSKPQHTDSELGGFLDSRRGGIVCVGALKGGVGKTAVASGLADWAGKILTPNNAAAAYVDANLNNPDAAGFFKEEIGQSMVSVRSVVAALVNNQVPPDAIKALTESVALYPERPGAVEYTRAEIVRFADYLRLQYRFTVVDLANVSPSIDGGPAATASLHWLGVADVIVVPTDLNPTSSLPDAYQYIASLISLFGPLDAPGGKPVLVPYIVPPDPTVERDPEVRNAKAALEGLGAALYPIPYNARVMVAGARHQSLTSISKSLAQAYRAVTEAAILAFASGDRYL